MSLTWGDLARLVHTDVVHARRADWTPSLPDAIRMHPSSWEDVVLAADAPGLSYWVPGVTPGAPSIAGARIEQDVDVPPGRIVTERWTGGWPPVLLWLEPFGEYAQIVRDGVAQAHPWLRLPGRQVRREEAPSRWDLMTAYIGSVGRWVTPEALEHTAVGEAKVRRLVEESLRAELRDMGIPETTADKVRFRWDLMSDVMPPSRPMWRVRPSTPSVTYPDVPVWARTSVP